MKVVANIVIDDFGPPPVIQVEATSPDQIVHMGESIKVFFPNIWIRNKLMPRLSLEIEIRKLEDQQAVRELLFLVQSNIDYYLRFWERRKLEAETGVFLP